MDISDTQDENIVNALKMKNSLQNESVTVEENIETFVDDVNPSTLMMEIDNTNPKIFEKSTDDVLTITYQKNEVTLKDFNEILCDFYMREGSLQKFVCKHCEYITTSQQHMKEHVGTHAYGLSFKCKLCGMRTKVYQSIRRHMKTTHDISIKLGKLTCFSKNTFQQFI